MNKKELSKLKRSLLALGMAGVILGTSGCGDNDDNDFLKDLIDNNYQVWLPDTGDYIEGYEVKDYYSLEEIKELEPQIETGLRAINKIKVKTK